MGGDGENVEMIVDDDTIRTVGKREKKPGGMRWALIGVFSWWALNRKTRLSLKRPTTS